MKRIVKRNKRKNYFINLMRDYNGFSLQIKCYNLQKNHCCFLWLSGSNFGFWNGRFIRRVTLFVATYFMSRLAYFSKNSLSLFVLLSPETSPAKSCNIANIYSSVGNRRDIFPPKLSVQIKINDACTYNLNAIKSK